MMLQPHISFLLDSLDSVHDLLLVVLVDHEKSRLLEGFSLMQDEELAVNDSCVCLTTEPHVQVFGLQVFVARRPLLIHVVRIVASHIIRVVDGLVVIEMMLVARILRLVGSR